MSENNYLNSQIKDFVKTNPDYYIHEFERINNASKFIFSFNLSAFLFGSTWFGIRNIWNWSLAFLIIETFAIVQIVRGFFGNISIEAYKKIDQIQSTIDFRQKQLQAAIESNSDKVDMFKRTIKSLEDSIAGYLQEAQSNRSFWSCNCHWWNCFIYSYKSATRSIRQFNFRKEIF